MVLIGYIHIRSGVDVIADIDRVVADDVAPATDHAAIADPQDRIRAKVVAGHHPRADRDLLGDYGLVSDLDPAFSVYGAGRKRDHRVLAESGEPATRCGLRRDGPGSLQSPPGVVHESRGYRMAPPGRRVPHGD